MTNAAPPHVDPPWRGFVETTGDALLILEAAKRGLIPRITRRLVDGERRMIASGSVFVFDEEESGIKSPSRILGNFLLYRETDRKGGGHGRRRGASYAGGGAGGGVGAGESLSRPRNETRATLDRHRERTLLGSLTNSFKFKADGLMKKTFSVTIAGTSQHLISYYKVSDVESGRLRAPSTLPELASLDISPTFLDVKNFRCPPKTESSAGACSALAVFPTSWCSESLVLPRGEGSLKLPSLSPHEEER
ncbi:Gti1/Pac2 family-domain-containing protein [Favolaschia claudopus]|uniref:Gti1/Pac2 family-domain-containing protein n=1 Tax=Favolaschia claudopus TaxID=2862362 RepID=A0AAV9ZUE9_9AGAR